MTNTVEDILQRKFRKEGKQPFSSDKTDAIWEGVQTRMANHASLASQSGQNLTTSSNKIIQAFSKNALTKLSIIGVGLTTVVTLSVLFSDNETEVSTSTSAEIIDIKKINKSTVTEETSSLNIEKKTNAKASIDLQPSNENKPNSQELKRKGSEQPASTTASSKKESQTTPFIEPEVEIENTTTQAVQDEAPLKSANAQNHHVAKTAEEISESIDNEYTSATETILEHQVESKIDSEKVYIDEPVIIHNTKVKVVKKRTKTGRAKDKR